MKSKIIEQITKTTSEMIEFKNKIKEENRIIQENGFFFKKDRYPDEVIFINPCGNDERNFDKFSEFIKKCRLNYDFKLLLFQSRRD